MEFRTIVSSLELVSHLDDPSWVVIDCRHNPLDFAAGYRDYCLSHIPGARFAHMADDLSGVTGPRTGRHPLPDPHAFVQKLTTWGVDNTKQVVVYDDTGSTYAARLWWMLRWVGHYRAAVLDGGWRHWQRVAKVVSSQQPVIDYEASSRFWMQLHEAAKVDIDFVTDHLESAYLSLIDARPPLRYLGVAEQQDMQLDPLAGHIPGAINHCYKANLDANDCFLPAEALRRTFTGLIGSTPLHRVIHQCGAGITACNNLLAMEIAGLHGTKLYPGSWSEWCRNPGRPMVTIVQDEQRRLDSSLNTRRAASQGEN